MATTTNFGWTTPNDTDLVKDGAQSIRTLGSNIDTSLVDLKGGTTGQVLAKASATDLDFVWSADAAGIAPTIFDAKGDIIAASAADTAARLAVGANNTVLTADSAEATGLKWATPAAPVTSYTLVNSGGTALSGSSTVTISGLTGYQNIFIQVAQASSASAASGLEIGFNSNGTNNYRGMGIAHGLASPPHSNFISNSESLRIRLSIMGSSSSDWITGALQIFGCNSTNTKPIIAMGSATGSGSNSDTRMGVYEEAAVISSVQIVSTIGNFDAGTVYVYAA
jgi:hypothetical protein